MSIQDEVHRRIREVAAGSLTTTALLEWFSEHQGEMDTDDGLDNRTWQLVYGVTAAISREGSPQGEADRLQRLHGYIETRRALDL